MKKLFLRLCLLSLCYGLVLFHQTANADGLADLKRALNSLNNKAEIRAHLSYSTSNTRNIGDETIQKYGSVMMSINANTDGLQMFYDDKVMTLLQTERALRADNEDAETPTLRAVNNIDAGDISRILNSSFGLMQLLKKAAFVNEQTIEKEGLTLRQLNFTLPLDSLISDKQIRKYVRTFSNSYQIIIDEQGIPIESHLVYEGKGRAYIVIRVESSGESHSQYAVHDGRLVRTGLTAIDRWDSTFGEGQNSEKEVLTILD